MPQENRPESLPDKQAVLVAIDFSPNAEAALVWACRYAHCMQVPVIAFHAVHEPADQPGFYKRDEKNQLESLEDVATKMMAAFLKRAKKNNPEVRGIGEVRAVLLKGLPAERIVSASEDLQAELVVMGRKRRSGLAHLLSGSIAEQVIVDSRVPVTVVKGPRPAAEETPSPNRQ